MEKRFENRVRFTDTTFETKQKCYDEIESLLRLVRVSLIDDCDVLNALGYRQMKITNEIERGDMCEYVRLKEPFRRFIVHHFTH